MHNFTDEQTERWLAALDRRAASAVVWLETPSGKLVIVKSDYKRHWSLPGGLVDAGETPLEAAVREVSEEIGVIVRPEALDFRMVISRTSGNLGMSYQFIFCTTITDEQLSQAVLQIDEIEEYLTVSRDEVMSKNRVYAPAIYAWANNEVGYAEHQL